MISGHLKVGRYQVFGFREGTFAIDGGAMFGVVPKIIWQKLYAADPSNRISLGLNSLLIDTGKTRVLIETGAGANLPPVLVRNYAIHREPGMDTALESLGALREDIDYVINTHLHFDHCGGNTRRISGGSFEPAFPRARYVVQRTELENARRPVSRDKPSYLEQTFACLEARGRIQTVEGETEIVPGIRVLPTPGHTAGHQCVLIQSQGESLLFLGDLVPTFGHLGLSYIMSFDLLPMDTYETKRRMLDSAVDSKWIVSTSHDPKTFFGRVFKKDGRYRHDPMA